MLFAGTGVSVSMLSISYEDGSVPIACNRYRFARNIRVCCNWKIHNRGLDYVRGSVLEFFMAQSKTIGLS